MPRFRALSDTVLTKLAASSSFFVAFWRASRTFFFSSSASFLYLATVAFLAFSFAVSAALLGEILLLPSLTVAEAPVLTAGGEGAV